MELNLAAMLDMAFQLLTFFILTFKPAPVEGDIVLHMPPPMPTTVSTKAEKLGSNTSNTSPVQALETLTITVVGNEAGSIKVIAVGDTSVNGLDGLDGKLRAILGDRGAPFEQVLIQVGAGLYYEELMQVVDVCTRQRLANGEKLSKLSFVELPER